MSPLIVTADNGGMAKPLPMVYVPPDRQLDDPDAATFAADSGLNGPFLADLLSDYLQHERCGVQLYTSLAGRTASSYLRAGYDAFGAQTLTHVDALEELIAALGGTPTYVSPAARACEKTGTALLESTFLLEGSVDAITREAVMLDAVLLAEARDHANWSFLADLAERAGGASGEAIQRAVDRVEPEEDEHLDWAKHARSAMALVLAEADALLPDERLAVLEERLESTAERLRSGGDEPVTKDVLYGKAKELDIPGRSTMTKDELQEALDEA